MFWDQNKGNYLTEVLWRNKEEINFQEWGQRGKFLHQCSVESLSGFCANAFQPASHSKSPHLPSSMFPDSPTTSNLQCSANSNLPFTPWVNATLIWKPPQGTSLQSWEARDEGRRKRHKHQINLKRITSQQPDILSWLPNLIQLLPKGIFYAVGPNHCNL